MAAAQAGVHAAQLLHGLGRGACRFCSTGFHLSPYRGRYPQLGAQRSTTPDMLDLQQLLAGMRDRGAAAAIVEASTAGLACGRCVRCS